MTAKLLASGVAALTIVGAVAAGITPAAGASTDQSGIWVQRVTPGPYAQETTPKPLGLCGSSLCSDDNDGDVQSDAGTSGGGEQYEMLPTSEPTAP